MISVSLTLYACHSHGKPGPSILKGNHKFLGNYQQCRDVTHGNFTGHTCRALIAASIGPVAFGSSPAVPRLQWDFCLPSSCKGPELTNALRGIGSNTTVDVECTPEFDLASDSGAIVSIAILSIFGMLVLVGTFLDLYVQFTEDRRFPIYTNLSTDHPEIELRRNSNMNQDPSKKLSRTPSVRVNPLSDTTMEDITDRVTVPGLMKDVPWATQSDFKDFSNRLSYRAQANGTLPTAKSNSGKAGHGSRHLPKWQQALLAFSLPKNTARIFSTEAGSGNIGCLHGV